MSNPRVPPRFVPTLTEVVEFGDALVVSDADLTAPEPLAPNPLSDQGAAEPPVLELAAHDLPVEPALHLTAEALASVVAPLLAPAIPTVEPTAQPEPAPEPAPEPSPEPSVAAAIATEDVPAFLLAAQSVPMAPVGAAAASSSAEQPVASALQQDEAVPEAPSVPVLDAAHEEQIVHNVLAELQRRTDLMLEYRLRETLNPILARLCDTLIKEAREDLAATLRDVVTRAVAQELGRHRAK